MTTRTKEPNQAYSLTVSPQKSISQQLYTAYAYWLTPKIKPVHLGFCPLSNPGLRVWKWLGLPGYPGCIPYVVYLCSNVCEGHCQTVRVLRNVLYHWVCTFYLLVWNPLAYQIMVFLLFSSSTLNSLSVYIVCADMQRLVVSDYVGVDSNHVSRLSHKWNICM